MAITRLDNISPGMLRWAVRRAGFSEEKAVETFPLLGDWLNTEKKPTVSQLQKFASKFFVPFGYLFLQQAPAENIPFPMFRGNAGQSDHFDLNVYDTVMSIRNRQDWLEDYLRENGIDHCHIVGSVSFDTPIGETVSRLHQILQLEPTWTFCLDKVGSAVNELTQQLEQAGVFVAYNGIVGNNTRRTLKVSECRGFALVNEVAPYIFVNSADSKSAQMFTLIHEAAHLMLGISAGHAGVEETASQDHAELYCDMVAAEFLVPAEALHEVWTGDIKQASRKFKVSEIVVARRAHDLSLLSNEAYRAFWQEYILRPIAVNNNNSGGNYYFTSVKRVGRLFAIHVRNAVNRRQLNYTDAYRLTGLYGNTYQHFMTNNI
jgi:Zn-dependent peptidase ImmA (M78 family)